LYVWRSFLCSSMWLWKETYSTKPVLMHVYVF
jgi:hypothetical protein